MEIKWVTADLSVSPQITPDDMPAIRASGFRSIICNRPDGESPEQPHFEDIRAAAEKMGLKVAYLPVIPGEVNDRDAYAFQATLSRLPGPTLAYCRSGARSASLWSMAHT